MRKGSVNHIFLNEMGENPSLESSVETGESVDSIVGQINIIYNKISDRESFRAIRQYCRGVRPNLILQTLIKMVSSLQSGQTCDENGVPFKQLINQFLFSFQIDVKIQNIHLYVDRMGNGIDYFLNDASQQKTKTFVKSIKSKYGKLRRNCEGLKETSTETDFTNCLDSFHTLNKSIADFIQIHKDNGSWSQQAKSYAMNLEKTLSQGVIITNLKSHLEKLEKSLQSLQILPPSSPRKQQLFQKRAITELDNVSSLVAWTCTTNGEINGELSGQIQSEIDNEMSEVKSVIPKRSSGRSPRRGRPSKHSIPTEEEIAQIPAKDVIQYHLRPYNRIQDLENENKKLRDFIRQCPHQPEEIRQLRQENEELASLQKSLLQELEELEFRLRERQK
ncbi:hypothetical protein TRFO_22739 [Tritrichomonas foetus]|uniref:Uncharacterized protein n=1 Tax=Tritrichomonas foetus TaxID=1144522 RepID=A0A1J4KCJ2_9EUKA|nr:hypothetical protein TRFO_22739 [Tritrichomonas foetus]|eukprot:OHT08656.1 hypothetical protein TRFO_22739 [Tritrichomonas foetus]